MSNLFDSAKRRLSKPIKTTGRVTICPVCLESRPWSHESVGVCDDCGQRRKENDDSKR